LGAPLRSRKLRCDLPEREYRLVPGRCDLFAAYLGDGSRYSRHLAHRFQRVRRRLRAIQIAAINERSARVRRGEKNEEQRQRQPFHSVDANRSVTACQCPGPFCKTRLHDGDVAGRFPFRQGLWIEDLRTPPGQECSNGSLILLAVVLWRAFSRQARPQRMAGI
jgi:hypothetical protein